MKILFLSILSLSTFANPLDLNIKNYEFYTSEGRIPNGCFAQLTTQLNGDNTVASVYLNRNTIRGCIASNIPYPGGNEEAVSYEIKESLANNTYKLNVCEDIEGSMGRSCDKILVQFVNKLYVTPKGSTYVLSAEKIGEW